MKTLHFAHKKPYEKRKNQSKENNNHPKKTPKKDYISMEGQSHTNC